MDETQVRARPEAHTIREAADRLRCSQSHIFKLIERGHLRRVRIGGRSLIPASEVDRLIELGTEAAS